MKRTSKTTKHKKRNKELGSSVALSSSGAKRLALTKLQGTAFTLDSKRPHQVFKASGGDALRGNTRSHPEHDG